MDVERESYVYFFYSDGRVKIGKANDVNKRYKTTKTYCPTELEILGQIECANETEAFELEKSLHEQYSSLRDNGEWFKMDKEEVLKIIDSINVDNSAPVELDYGYLTELGNLDLFYQVQFYGTFYRNSGYRYVVCQVFESELNSDYKISIETEYGKGEVGIEIKRHPNGLPSYYRQEHREMKNKIYNDTLFENVEHLKWAKFFDQMDMIMWHYKPMSLQKNIGGKKIKPVFKIINLVEPVESYDVFLLEDFESLKWCEKQNNLPENSLFLIEDEPTTNYVFFASTQDGNTSHFVFDRFRFGLMWLGEDLGKLDEETENKHLL